MNTVSFYATVRSKLPYGLECLQLTEAEQSRLDAFQMKGIRRILQIQLLNYQQKKVHYPRKTTGYIFPNNKTIFSDEWKKKTVNTNFEPM